MVGKGFSGLYAGPRTTEDDRTRSQYVMQTVGDLEWVESEDDLHLVTAGPGSGPAYVFLFMEALAGRSYS
jgi:pyrroline-5-carboxylate reductase